MTNDRGRRPPRLPIRFGNWGQSGKVIRFMGVGGPQITSYLNALLSRWSDEVVFLSSPERLRQLPALWYFGYQNLQQARFFLEAAYSHAHPDIVESHQAGPIHVLVTQVRFAQPGSNFLELISTFLEAAPFYPRLYLIDHEGDTSLQEGVQDWICSLDHQGLEWSLTDATNPECLRGFVLEILAHLNELFDVDVPLG